MTGVRGTRVSRWVAIVALTAAGTLATGVSAAAAAPSPTPSPAPSGSTSPSPSAPTSTPGSGRRPATDSAKTPAACVRGPQGEIVNCHAHVPKSKRPAGAQKTTTLADPGSDLSKLVDTRTWTTGGGNTYPGAQAPFGMTQWSPDTLPNRSAGGGYSYGDSKITGYSLTHVSGPGCGAGGDIPILPTTGALPDGNPNDVTTSFTNDGEVAQAGYYSAQTNQPDTIKSEFTATAHSSMGRFTYPATDQADMLIKLHDSQNGEFAPSTATVVGDNEVTGSETSGHFCGEANNDGQQQEYTVHFDIQFDQPFTAHTIVTGDDGPEAVELTFDTTQQQVVQAKVGISFVSDANAGSNWKSDNPGWNFDQVKQSTQQQWNTLLGRMQVSGGDYNRTQMFYSLLYKDFLQPNITSDVNGQYMGADMTVHSVREGQDDQYGVYSGWDTYHSLAQLQAMLDPAAASDQAQSLLNYYAQDKILQQWGYYNLNNYVMVGDPAQSIIADYYAFGARNFDTAEALADMMEQATTTNDVRPGQNLQDKYGYLPEDGSYRSCCNAHGFVSSMLEYDSNDLALSHFAATLGDKKDAAMLQRRANDWQNVFNPKNDLLNPRNTDGSFVPGITDTTSDHYVEGDAIEYLWNVPNDYSRLISLLGGKDKAAQMLRRFLSQPNGYGEYAQLTNEFGFGEQYALNYAGDPAATQQIVNNIRNTMYQPGPSLDNNDDLGANSSTFIWEMLGMYPENSGFGNLTFNSPGFPHAAITLPSGKTVHIDAPNASPDQFYVKSLQVNGKAYQKLYIPFSTLAKGAQLDWTLVKHPTSWGSAPADAPPSYTAGTDAAVGYLGEDQVDIVPGGGAATVKVGAQNATEQHQDVHVEANAPSPLQVSLSTNTDIALPPHGRNSISLKVSAPKNADQTFYTVPITLSAGGKKLRSLTLRVLVAPKGSLLRAFNNVGISADSNVNAADFDGGGWSYSADALAAQGVTPGGTVHAGDIDYTWPTQAPGLPDNAIAMGQQVSVDAPQGTTQLGFLGAANSGPSQGLVTLHYADGSSTQFWLGQSDWTLNGGSAQPSFGNVVAVTTPYRNCDHCTGGRDSVKTNVFSSVVPVDAGKTLVSVTLPDGATQGQLHVFSIGTSTAAISGPVVTSVDPASVDGGDVVTINGSGFGDSRGNGYVHFQDNNTSWGAPGNTAAFTVNSWSDTKITFTVPPATGQYHVAPGTNAMVTVVTDSGAISDTALLKIKASADLADYYDNTGISSDDNQSCADFDGGGYSYSAEALAAAGATPGGTITVGGLHYTWPSAPACQPDNILAAGQTILVNGAAGASTIGFLGSSGNGSTSGPVTVTYTDGSTTTAPLSFTDWAQAPSGDQELAVQMPYRNTANGTSQQITMYVDAMQISVDPTKTVQSVTLPMVADHIGDSATMHVFAIASGS